MSRKKPIKVRLYNEDSKVGVGGRVVLDAGQAHYVRDVMRARCNDVISLFDGMRGEWLCRISCISHKTVEVEIEKPLKEYVPTRDLVLCFALVRNDIVRSIVRQSTEMGVTLLQPVYTKYSSVSDIDRRKCRLWAIEASEQCGRQDIPQVAPVVDFIALREFCSPERQFVLCDETGTGKPPREVLRGDRDAWVIVGPEGGFSGEELHFSEGFCDKISLGPRILRVDTAVVCALAYANDCYLAV
ncbi:16S rRNA (uracil(1498)-N(3))-methyltransferase [Anaplasma capra]|uniref:16S rRNA (uracil(1498)-N(3))-methyltransferase n=1 Tax=Anaplasma capra TaxID=1562740 RepID=UPI0021D592C6|nr:16S rRNA (uracil(1498)-N(3))-methyltransferase [Anaplasma capra]MCU7611943.1 16S rRNA (uracil(1498)-N(3))-methyltransferase [Anaplasma capra]MCU7612267.1 16S rRNA (uracil(1498)-N(3))-methyltransferase [Anaplasma capra]